MSTFRAAMLGCLVLIASACGGRAMAVPPVMPHEAARALVGEYMKAVRNNDLQAYVALFAPDATIVSDWPTGADRDGWLKAVAVEFAPTRRAQFLAVFSEAGTVDGKPATRVLLVQEIKDCRPAVIECFGQFRNESLVIRNGAIVALERSRFTYRLLEPGGWTYFAP